MSLPDRNRRPFYWERHTDGDGRWRRNDRPSGQDLAALRRGLGRQPGEVPAMWPFYTSLTGDGAVSPQLRAEHVALTLFAVHQQAKDRPTHRAGIGLGTALLAVRRSGKFSPEAVDRRFAAAATATTVDELTGHLRGLVTQLRALDQTGQRGQGLDYTQLVADLRDWLHPERLVRVRRRWGGQYFTATADKPDDGNAVPGVNVATPA